jgi:hypothetical protein
MRNEHANESGEGAETAHRAASGQMLSVFFWFYRMAPPLHSAGAIMSSSKFRMGGVADRRARPDGLGFEIVLQTSDCRQQWLRYTR